MTDGPARDEDAARAFVERMALLLTSLGFPRMPARVLIALMAAEERGLTAAQICERLGVSPAAVSGAVRLLTQLGLVARDPVPGSRRDLYHLVDDAWYEASMVKEGYMTRVAEMADAGVAALGGEQTRAGARLAEMRDFYAFIDGEMPGLLARWDAQRGDRARRAPDPQQPAG